MLKREIGSDFHISSLPTGNINDGDKYNVFSYLQEFPKCFFDSGRSALRALLKEIKCKKVLLPGYICESVRNCFPDSAVTYYHIDDFFSIDWTDLLEKCNSDIDILYLHFFNGYIGKDYDFGKLLEIKAKRGFLIIEDTTHSFLSAKKTVGDYCICSLRKWFPVADGGVLYADSVFPFQSYPSSKWADEKTEAMIAKNEYLKGKNVKKDDFLTVFANAEKALDAQKQPFGISKQSYQLLEQINIRDVIDVRRQNYAVLNKHLGYKQVAYSGSDQTPLFFMISVENRDDLRQFLIEKCVYCPVHWPLYDEVQGMKDTVMKYQTELSIPVDQRYDLADMRYIVEVLSEYAEKTFRCKETL